MSAAWSVEPQLTVAAVDMGSNSFHLIIATLQGHQVVPLLYKKHSLALISGIKNGRLSGATLLAMRECLTEFSKMIAQYRPARVLAVGTAAFRQLLPAAYQSAIQEVFPWHTIVLSGSQEAEWVYDALVQAIPLKQKVEGHFVLDIGGGSTECAFGQRSNYCYGRSLDLGCLALQHEIPWPQSITLVGYQRLYTRCAVAYVRLTQGFPGVRDLWMSEGIAARLAKVMGIGVLLSRPVLDSWILRQLKERTSTANATLDALTWYGAVILQAAVHRLGIERIHLTAYALRDGILHRLLQSPVAMVSRAETNWLIPAATSPIRLPII